MAKGDRFVERVRYEDELTGASGWQLTSFPTHSMTLGYSANQFTPDGGTVLFACELKI